MENVGAKIFERNLEIVDVNGSKLSLKIQPTSIDFVNSEGEPIRRFKKDEIEESLILNTWKFGHYGFSVVLNRRTVFNCSKETYNALEDWLGYKTVIRVNLRDGWLMSFITGAILLYNTYPYYLSHGLSGDILFSAFAGSLLLLTGLLAKIFPRYFVVKLDVLAWIIIIIRDIYVLQWNITFLFLLFLLISIWFCTLSYSRYKRVNRLMNAA